MIPTGLILSCSSSTQLTFQRHQKQTDLMLLLSWAPTLLLVSPVFSPRPGNFSQLHHSHLGENPQTELADPAYPPCLLGSAQLMGKQTRISEFL